MPALPDGACVDGLKGFPQAMESVFPQGQVQLWIVHLIRASLKYVPIGTHADNFFAEPDFSVPPEARRKHMALFGGPGTGKSTLLTNMAASDLDAGAGITVVDPHGGFYEMLVLDDNLHVQPANPSRVIF